MNPKFLPHYQAFPVTDVNYTKLSFEIGYKDSAGNWNCVDVRKTKAAADKVAAVLNAESL